MERGRGRGRATKKRSSLSSHSSHSQFYAQQAAYQQSSFPSQPLDLQGPSTPTAADAGADLSMQRVPGSVPVRGAKSKAAAAAHAAFGGPRTTSPISDSASRQTPRNDRPPRSSTFGGSFALGQDSPSSAAMAGASSSRTLKRARTFDPTPDGSAADDEGVSKGGHSLRKRARVDYTVMEQLDDDSLGIVSKPDALPKLSANHSGRARKKKHHPDGLEDDGEIDHVPSNGQKRRRPQKSPALSRGGRRRTQSRKLTTEVETYHVTVAQPPEDEVQDTILVGFPTVDGLAESEAEESDEGSNSFDESETRPSTSDGSETAIAQAEAEPATPKPQSGADAVQAVSLVTENEEAIENGLLTEEPDSKPEVAPEPVPVPLQAQEPVETEPQREAEDVASEPAQTITTNESVQEQQKSELESPVEPPPVKIEDAAPETVDALPADDLSTATLPLSTSDSTAQALPQELATRTKEEIAHAPTSSDPLSQPTPSPLPRREWSSSPRRMRPPRSKEPARMKALEKIYQTPAPFASALGLSPYENEDIALPGAYTERVRPEEKEKSTASRMPTPALSSAPAEMSAQEPKWDGSRPLKLRELTRLYRQELKKCEERGEEAPTMVEFHNQCIRRYNSLHQPGATTSTPSANSVATSRPGVSSAQKPALTLLTSMPAFEDTPQGSQADSVQPSAAPSPVAAEEEEPQLEPDIDDADEEPEVADPEPPARAGATTAPIEVTRKPAQQWQFPKLRDPQEFVDSLENFQDMDSEELYVKTAAATEAMHLMQLEYTELRKILDDEENAKRRVANEKAVANWENRQKWDEPLLPVPQSFDEPLKGYPNFEVRGVRAPKPYTDPLLDHQRQEDLIMAQAYGFKHNPHPSLVGRQNPLEQRWEMSENRLRERKKTEKAQGAELAEENVIEGKRVRKPRNLSDQSKEPSRAGTPVGGALPGRRGPGRWKFGAKDDEDVEMQDAPEPEPAPPPVSRRGRGRGGYRGGRGAYGHAAIAERAEKAPTGSASQADGNQTEEEVVEEKPGSARKRARGWAVHPAAPAVSDSRGSRRQDVRSDIASSSFYSHVSVDTQAESRPSTSSSAATVNTEETGESTYSLREKRKRNFVFENDPELSHKRSRAPIAMSKLDTAEPKKRAPRRKPTVTSQPILPEPVSLGPTPTPTPVPVPTHLPTVQAPSPLHIPQPMQLGGGLQAPPFFSNPPPAIAPAPGPYLHTFSATPAFPPGGNPPPPAAPPAVKKPITKIKLTNNGGSSSQNSSRAPTPANIAPNPTPKIVTKGSRPAKTDSATQSPAANDTSALDNKSYAEMSKSEKMSWSMKRRWASGEMQGAVEKRRATLANKKAEKAATGTSTPVTASNSVEGTPVPQPQSQVRGMMETGSGSGTPTPVQGPMGQQHMQQGALGQGMMQQQGPLPLAMPGQNGHGLIPPPGAMMGMPGMGMGSMGMGYFSGPGGMGSGGQ